MSASVKLGLIAMGCFIAGILVGMSIESSGSLQRGKSNHVGTIGSESSDKMLSADVLVPREVETGKAKGADPIQRKLKRVSQYAEESIPVMVSPFGGSSLNPVFVLLFELTEVERSRLEAALEASTRRFKEIENRSASGGLSSDGKKVIVKVPPMPQAGGAVYDDLLDSFASVLGEDRFDLFNAVSRRSFDQRFDNFGLNAVIYELELPTQRYSTQTTFNIVRSFMAPNGVTKGSSTSSLNLEGLNQYYPVVVKFIPPEFRKEPIFRP